MRRLSLALLLCAAGAARAERPVPTWYETSLLVAAEASLAADMLQTLDIKRHPDTYSIRNSVYVVSRGLQETNPLLGAHPSDARIWVSCVASGVAMGLAWHALPRGWRILVPLAVLAVEIPNLEHNARMGLSIRF